MQILVVPLRFIGDAVLTVPLLRAIKTLYPEASLDVLVPIHLVNLFQTCPYIDNLLIEPADSKALAQTIAGQNYDIAFLLRRSLTQARMLKKAGVKTLVGYDEQRFFAPFRYLRTGWYLDWIIHFPPVDTDIEQVKTYLSMLSPFTDVSTLDESLELWTDEYDTAGVEELFQTNMLDETKPLALFHATSASKEKAMDAAKFYPALKQLHDAGFQIATVGAAVESIGYDDIANASGVPLVNLAGLTTLRETYLLMKRAKILLSLDSGPVHIAAAAGIPHIIAIYGPTNEKQWRPYPYHGEFTPVYNTSLTCRPCVPKVCSHNKCRVDLTGVDILLAVQKHVVTETSEPVEAV